MRFPTVFTRYKGTAPAGGKALGADTLPIDSGSSPIPANAALDNVLYSRFSSINGWPLTRVALAAKYTGGGSPAALPVTLYFYEAALDLWVKLDGASSTVTPGTPAAPAAVTFFDVVALLDLPKATQDMYEMSSGSLSALLIVGDPGAGAPDGRYDFALAPDLTPKPF